MVPLGDELRATLGAPRKPQKLDSSPRSHVWRVELSGTPAVVKQLLEDDPYTREVTALRLAARVDPPVVPRLLGSDPVARVIVLEYLEARRPTPEDWLIDYAEALARLHSATGPDDAGALPAWAGPQAHDIDSFLRLAGRLEVRPPAGVEAELGDLVDRLDRTRGHALLHGDPCPGNDLHTGDGMRFIDFEQSSLGDGLVELAYLRVGFPTCWCVTAPPEPLLSEAEAAYRAATGTEGDVTDACVGWLIRGDALVQRAYRGTDDHLARVVEKDWEWGTVTARQRLAYRLGVVARLTADRDDLTALHRLTTALLTRWPTLAPPPPHRP